LRNKPKHIVEPVRFEAETVREGENPRRVRQHGGSHVERRRPWPLAAPSGVRAVRPE